MHIIDQITPPIIFAHRGASAFAPENTMAAFDLAFKQNAHAIEIDTMLSADGIPIVIHDRNVERTTNGTGNVDQLTVNQLRELDAGSRFSEEFTGEKIPLLKEVLERYGHNHLINIELKNYHAVHDNLPTIVAEMIERFALKEYVLISSFIPRNLKRLREKHPDLKLALLCMNGLPGKLCQSRLFYPVSPDCVHPAYQILSEDVIKKNHKRNRRVHAWTVDDEETALELVRNGVDGIITNVPLKMTKLLFSI